MDTTLTVSSQGQVVIPRKVRELLGLKAGSKIMLTVNKNGKIPTATLITKPASWVKYVAGLGKSVWGRGEDYIEKERKSWEK